MATTPTGGAYGNGENVQPGLTDTQLIDFAVGAGAPRAPGTEAVQNQTHTGWVASVTENASNANITRTPTVIINGTTLGTHEPAAVRHAIEAASR